MAEDIRAIHLMKITRREKLSRIKINSECSVSSQIKIREDLNLYITCNAFMNELAVN